MAGQKPEAEDKDQTYLLYHNILHIYNLTLLQKREEYCTYRSHPGPFQLPSTLP